MKSILYYLALVALTCLATGCHQNGQQKNAANTDSIFNRPNREQEVTKEKIKDPFFKKLAGDQPLIIPGHSIGKVVVGGETQQQTKLLGSPQKSEAGMCKRMGSWFYGDTTKSFTRELDIFSECDPGDDMKPHIKWIRTTDAAFKTKEGLGVRSTYASIQSGYPSMIIIGTYSGKNDAQQMIIMNDVKAGISFEVEAKNNKPLTKGKCRALLVSKPGIKTPSLYFSFYKDLKLLNP